MKHNILTKQITPKNALVIDGEDASKRKASIGASAIGKEKPVWLLTQQ
ncbi:MAG: hypothetical protein ABGY95_07685 [Rubritalea sp.]